MAGRNKKIRLDFENLRSLAFGSIGAAYTIVGTAFTHPLRAIKLYNGTDQDVYYSTDGTNDKDYLPSLTTFVFDISTNRSNKGDLLLRDGVAIYVKQGPAGAPSSGSFFVTAIYAD